MKQKLLLMLIGLVLVTTMTTEDGGCVFADSVIIKIEIDDVRRVRHDASAESGSPKNYNKDGKCDLKYFYDFRGTAIPKSNVLVERLDNYHSTARPTHHDYLYTLQDLFFWEIAKTKCKRKIICGFKPDKAYTLLEAAYVWNDLAQWEDITREEYDSICKFYTGATYDGLCLSMYDGYAPDCWCKTHQTFADCCDEAPNAYANLFRAHTNILRKTGATRDITVDWEYVRLLMKAERAYRYSHEGEHSPQHLMDTAIHLCTELLTDYPPEPLSQEYFDKHIMLAICRMAAYGYDTQTKEALTKLYNEAVKAHDTTHADDLLCLQTEGELLNQNYEEAIQLQNQCYKERLKYKKKNKRKEQVDPIQADYMELWRTALIANNIETVTMCERLMWKEYEDIELDFLGYSRIGERYILPYRRPLDVLFEERFTQGYEKSSNTFSASRQQYGNERMWEGTTDLETGDEDEEEDDKEE